MPWFCFLMLVSSPFIYTEKEYFHKHHYIKKERKNERMQSTTLPTRQCTIEENKMYQRKNARGNVLKLQKWLNLDEKMLKCISEKDYGFTFYTESFVCFVLFCFLSIQSLFHFTYTNLHCLVALPHNDLKVLVYGW